MIGLPLIANSRIGWALLALMAQLAALFVAYGHGRSTTEDAWQARWSARNASDAAARQASSEAERHREHVLQHAINQVNTDAQQQIDTALTQAADAANAADGLRQRVEQLLAADRARRSTCVASSRPAAENPGNLLAVVLDQSVARNRELAAIADTARIAGQACERAFDVLAAKH
ncbi:hypothetical protein PS3A_60580 [Pseudomonas sp. 3A(2025)]